MSALRPATYRQVLAVAEAIESLRLAAKYLADAQCPKALARVRLALSSAEGAQRHIGRRAAHTP
jgi:hypothetical protein